MSCVFKEYCLFITISCISRLIIKGQIKPKADWHAVNSPKKRTNKFVLFAFLLFTANKTNSFFRFLEESTWRQSCFLFHLTFSTSISYKKMLKSFFDILLYLNRSGKVVKNKELKTTERLKIILNSITTKVVTNYEGPKAQ